METLRGLWLETERHDVLFPWRHALVCGDAVLEQTAQRVTVRRDYDDTNFLAVVRGTFRYDF